MRLISIFQRRVCCCKRWMLVANSDLQLKRGHTEEINSIRERFPIQIIHLLILQHFLRCLYFSPCSFILVVATICFPECQFNKSIIIIYICACRVVFFYSLFIYSCICFFNQS